MSIELSAIAAGVLTGGELILIKAFSDSNEWIQFYSKSQLDKRRYAVWTENAVKAVNKAEAGSLYHLPYK